VVGGFSNAIVNVLIQSLIQLSTPQEMRGKVMGLLEALTGGLVPIGMALGGLLGEFLPLRLVIFLAFALAGVVGIPPLLAPSIREFFGGRNQA
jgi:DHA3 family macrolide efflux protein-like MFS transporter